MNQSISQMGLSPLNLFGANNVRLLWHITHFSSNVLKETKALWGNKYVASVTTCSFSNDIDILINAGSIGPEENWKLKPMLRSLPQLGGTPCSRLSTLEQNIMPEHHIVPGTAHPFSLHHSVKALLYFLLTNHNLHYPFITFLHHIVTWYVIAISPCAS